MPDITELEKDIAADRNRLTHSLDSLSAAIKPDNVKQHATALAESYGGDIGRQTWDAARKNPAAFALVGAGLGLLFTGTGTRPQPREAAVMPRAQAAAGFEARVEAADEAIKASQTGTLAPQAPPRAAWLRAKLNDGLDTLPQPAKDKVLQARKAALNAQEQVETQTRKVATTSKSALNDQPLAVGAVALGLGALIGAVLPSTRREDDLLGERRDAFMAAAKASLDEELSKLRAKS